MLFTIFGIVGSLMIIYSFILIQKSHSWLFVYNILNLIGSILLLIALIDNPDIGNIIIQIFSIVINLYFIIKALRVSKSNGKIQDI